MINNESLFTFNEFFLKILMLNQSDHENIKAILNELGAFKTLAEQATEVHKVFQQLDDYEGSDIKIHLGTEGTISWPADELMIKVKAKMSNAVIALKAQELVIDRMAKAISGDVVYVEAEEYAADMWFLKWRRDVNEFADKHTWLRSRVITTLHTHGARQHVHMLKNGVESPKFQEALPAIIIGEISVKNCGDMMQDDLQKALDSETDEDNI